MTPTTRPVVALLDPRAASAETLLGEYVEEPVEFRPVPDPNDLEAVGSVLRSSDVVVGTDLPMQVPRGSPLRLIQTIGAGTERLDRSMIPPEAYLCNVYGHARSIAEHVLLLVLALRHDLLATDGQLRRGIWDRGEPSHAGKVRELGGLTMGIVGFGRIGRALVEPATAFGMDVIAIRGHRPDGDPPDGVSFLGGPDDLDRILADADVLVLAVPLTDVTRGLIGDGEFGRMKDDAVLVNVARGPVVDESALFTALRDGRIGGAGIDTWYRYPDGPEAVLPSSYPIHELPNVVVTPHIAGWSRETAEYRWRFIAGNIDRIARGERPENVVLGPGH